MLQCPLLPTYVHGHPWQIDNMAEYGLGGHYYYYRGKKQHIILTILTGYIDYAIMK